MTATWCAVPEWDGWYEVSDEGDVRSVDRLVETATGVRRYRGKVLRQTPHPKGYRLVSLHRGARETITAKVHQLVAAAFLGKRPEGLATRHWDGNPTNNHVGNLLYGTTYENSLDMVRHGRSRQASQVECIRGHELSGPNLRHPDKAHPHRRQCRACWRAHAVCDRARQRGEVPDMQATADSFYVELAEVPA